MTPDQEIELNAFVDGQLSPDQHAEFLAAMERDPELAQAAHELANLKARVDLAYLEPPERPATLTRPARLRGRAWVAALALLALGLSAGWVLHGQLATPERFVVLDTDGRALAPATADSPETRIVFHVNNPDQMLAGELLDDVENLLQMYRDNSRPLRIEVVSHGEGLALLRERLTTHKVRITRLAETYDNLSFVACQNTIDRLKVERGIEVRLIPAAAITPSGVSHVVRRQRQGWSYIRV